MKKTLLLLFLISLLVIPAVYAVTQSFINKHGLNQASNPVVVASNNSFSLSVSRAGSTLIGVATPQVGDVVRINYNDGIIYNFSRVMHDGLFYYNDYALQGSSFYGHSQWLQNSAELTIDTTSFTPGWHHVFIYSAKFNPTSWTFSNASWKAFSFEVQPKTLPTPVAPTIPVSGGVQVQTSSAIFQIQNPNDLITLNEPLGNIKTSLSNFELPTLRSGTITTQYGVTGYDQYLYLFDRTDSLTTIFNKDENGFVGDFLYAERDAPLFEWNLEFQQGVSSSLTGNKLLDLNDRELNIFDRQYRIIDAEYDSVATSLSLKLIGGGLLIELREGSKRQFTYNNKIYDVEVMVISSVNKDASIIVNGQQLPKMKTGDIEPLPNGEFFGVSGIFISPNPNQSNIAQMYIDASEITFTDDDVLDNLHTPKGTVINNERIEKSDVRINAFVSGNVVTLQSIDYILNADPLTTFDVWVPPGHGIREYLEEPEGMLSPTFDIYYQGLTAPKGVSYVKIRPLSYIEYTLDFTNAIGVTYTDVPLLALRNNNLEWGNTKHKLVWIEHPSELIYEGDYFILSHVNGFSTSVLQFNDVDTKNSVLTFTDLASGTKQVTYANNQATLIVGGNVYDVYIDPLKSTILVDLNGDGQFQDAVRIFTEGNLFIDLVPFYPSLLLSVPQNNIDEAMWDEYVFIPFEHKQSGNIGIDIASIWGVELFNLQAIGMPEIHQGMTEYGSFFEVFDDPNPSMPEELTVEVPLSQRTPEVFVVS